MDPETAEISGVKPKLFLSIGEKHEVEGSGKRPWTIKRCEAGYYTCSCGAFQHASGSIRKRSCPHLKSVLGGEYEEARRLLEAKNAPATKPAATSSAGDKRKTRADDAADDKKKWDNVTSLTSGPAPDDPDPGYEDLVESQAEAANKKQKYNGIEYDAFHGSVMFNGRTKTKGYDKDSAIAIMLSESCDLDKMNPKGWWMSEKLDGVRAYWTGERLISRSNIDWKPPQWFIDKLPKGFALDGELWRERDGFEELSGMCRRADHAAWSTINYFVFDAPDLELPFEERIRAALKRVPDGEMAPDDALQGRFGGRIAMLPQKRCMGKEHLLQYLDEIEKVCGEGVMLRRPHSPYERKRSKYSLKLKSTYDAEALVVGYTAGKGRHVGEMGSLGLLMECGTIFTCGSGLTNEMRREWLPQRGTVVRYRFSELTADHVPRFPVYMGICPDRSAAKDAVCRTTDFRMQRKQKRIEEERLRAEQRVRDGLADEQMDTERKASPLYFEIGTRKVTMAELCLGKPGRAD